MQVETLKLHREFVIDREPVVLVAHRFVDSNWRSFEAANTPLRLIITTQEEKRREAQNRYYWRGVIQQISEQVWVDGRQYSKEVWHEHLAGMFGVMKELEMPDGSKRLVRKSTTDMSVKEFSHYIEECTAFAAMEYGVRFFVQEGRY